MHTTILQQAADEFLLIARFWPLVGRSQVITALFNLTSVLLHGQLAHQSSVTDGLPGNDKVSSWPVLMADVGTDLDPLKDQSPSS